MDKGSFMSLVLDQCNCGSLRKPIRHEEDFERGIKCNIEFFIHFKVT